MACSKILSGDIPELLNDIIQYFRNDFSTLHSCILVNRLWCHLAIPLLWEDPFSISKTNHVIKIYLHNLNDDDKAKLNECGINDDSFPSNTLFNYPSFIKCLNITRIFSSIESWVPRPSDPFIRYCPLYLNSVKFIFDLLSKTFIENNANIHTLEVVERSFRDNLLIEKFSVQIISSQQNLKMIVFQVTSFSPLLLLSLNNSNWSNTLKTIVFNRIDFSNIVILNEVFENLNVLESIHFLYCFPLNSNFIQQILSVTKPFKLKSLFIVDYSIQIEPPFEIEPLQLLLQKSGDYLQNIGVGLSISYELKQQQLFELIKKYCTKIKYFDLHESIHNNIHLISDIMKNVQQSLNYLNIYETSAEFSSILLRNLGQILPFKLEYLYLSININTSDFELFLKNSQNTFIKKLIIRNENHQNILPYVKKYIMNEKRVRYLTLYQIYCREDLASLTDEVNEFKLYNIEIQPDRHIDYYELMKEYYLI